jgi:hypothetical protein
VANRQAANPANQKPEKVNFRLSTELLDKLQAAAKAAGHATSQEITHRLEDSFGANLAAEDRFGGVHTYALCRLVSAALGELRNQTGHGWHSDRFTFDHAVKAVNEILSYFPPAGDPEVPDDLPMAQRLRDLGLDTAAVEEQAKGFPFGVLAARLAAFKVETATPESEQVYRRIRDDAGAKMVGSPQADLVDWKVR